MARVSRQFRLLVGGRPTNPNASPAVSLALGQLLRERALRRYRAWLPTQPTDN